MLRKTFTIEFWIKIDTAKDAARVDLFSNGHLTFVLNGL